MRMLIGEIVRAIGVRDIWEASNGAEGLQMVNSHPVDIVMTDLAMQPLDGIDLTRLLRNPKQSLNPTIPVVMITGHSTLKRVNEARDAGVSEFLAKPLTARGVIDRLNQAIEHPRAFIRSRDYFGPDRRRRVDVAWPGPWRRSSDEAQQSVARLEL